MTADHLADILRWVGVIVALVASFLAAPAATRGMIRSTTAKIEVARNVVRDHAVRLWAWLTRRTRGTVVAILPALEASGAGSMTFTGTARGEAPPVDLESRVSRLEKRVAELQDLTAANEKAITAEAAERQQADELLEQRITEEVATIRSALTTAEEEARRVDASALPVVGLGIVLSGVPDYLATWTWLGAVCIVAALLSLQRALLHFWVSGPTAA